ncbi:MAG: 2-hydroxyglutaryl-CoA dehydratase [Chloroflexi bacterium]|nr:2-hydroxyglutaryl-CoA dehydratase [Chloroflexota bacterium]
MTDICALGIDVGSTTVKIVGVDAKGNLVWHTLEQAEPRIEDQAARLIETARRESASPENIPIVATGYGRGLVSQATRKVTEITCHARGIYRELGHGGTLVDIGGQDSKVIAVSPKGDVIDFAMNDKCAAGTGRFLEHSAQRLRVPLEQIGQVSLGTTAEVVISSTCTVFAESEIISLLAHGVAVDSILRGLHRSLIKRIVAMVRSVGLVSPLMLSGGVAQNQAIARMLEEETQTKVMLPKHPQLMGAYGAALVATKDL